MVTGGQPVPRSLRALDAEAVEGLEQVGHRPLAHPRACRRAGRSRAAVASMAVRNRRLVPELATYRLAWRDRDAAAAALNANLGSGGVVDDGDAERFERLNHDPRVLAVERPGQRARPIGQRGDDQRAIGQALRAGHANRGRRRRPLQGSIVISAG